MKNEKIGPFIKNLRMKQGWSQEILANKIFCTRLKIHRIENNIQYPDLDDLIAFTEIFNVTLEEIVYGEMKTKKNENDIKNNFLQFLKLNDSKFKKIKLVSFFLGIIIFLLSFFLVFLYFFQNYSTIRVYKFYGNSEHYQVLNGMLILSKDKVYFDIKQIEPSTNLIEIYSEIKNEKKLVYKGSHQNILNDLYGYSAFISYDDFIEGNQKLFLKINNEEMQLNFVEDFVNNSFWYKEKHEMGTLENEKLNSIPSKILEKFKCSENSCVLEKKDEKIIFSENVIIILKNNCNMNFDITNKIFSYQSTKENEIEFIIENETITCIKGNCENANKIFEEFTTNYLDVYLD